MASKVPAGGTTRVPTGATGKIITEAMEEAGIITIITVTTIAGEMATIMEATKEEETTGDRITMAGAVAATMETVETTMDGAMETAETIMPPYLLSNTRETS